MLLDLALDNIPLANKGMDLAQKHLNKLRNQQNQLLLGLYLDMVAKLLALYEVLALYLGLDLKLEDLDLELSLGKMPFPLLKGKLDRPMVVLNQ